MEISIKNLTMKYKGGKNALDDITLELKSSNLIGLLGPNGAGKTTLMNILVGALLPTKGSILVDGVSFRKNEKKIKSKLGYLPQTFGLYEELSVWQFLDYMAALKGIKESAKEIDRVIGETNLFEKRKMRISTLSGGQRQRVGIAQALLGNPELLIFDEPTVGLDPEERITFRKSVSEMAKEKTVLLSTHIIEDVQTLCNQLIVINHGNILFVGPPEKLISETGGREDEKNALETAYVKCIRREEN